MLRSLWTYLLAGCIGVFGLTLTACEPADDNGIDPTDQEEVDDNGDNGDNDDY